MTRLRGLLWTCLVAGLVIATVEVLCFVALSLTEHRLMSWGAVATARMDARAASGDVDPALELSNVPVAAFLANYVVHPYLGFVLRRDFLEAKRLERGGADALDYGFHFTEPGLIHEVAPHQLVIAITGGSVANAFAHQTVAMLRDELRRLRPEIERVVVVNLALPGYKQPQQLMSVAWVLALGAHFDAVVNIDGYNDVALAPIENVPKDIFPFYPRGWSFYVSTFDPEFQLRAGEVQVLRRVRAQCASVFGRIPWRYSMAAGLVWVRLDRALARAVVERDAALVSDPDTAEPSFRATGPHKAYASAQELHADLAAVWKRSSEQIAHLARGHGAIYLHFLQPNQHVPDSKRFDSEELATAIVEGDPHGQLVRAVYPRLQEHGRELQDNGVRFFDLTRLFENETEPIYIDSCCHFNRRGNDLLMREVARQLAAALP